MCQLHGHERHDWPRRSGSAELCSVIGFCSRGQTVCIGEKAIRVGGSFDRVVNPDQKEGETIFENAGEQLTSLHDGTLKTLFARVTSPHPLAPSALPHPTRRAASKNHRQRSKTHLRRMSDVMAVQVEGDAVEQRKVALLDVIQHSECDASPPVRSTRCAR